MPSPYVVCAKFRDEVSTPFFPEPQPVVPPMAEHWNDPWSGTTIPRETDGSLWGKRESKEDIKQQRRGTVEGNQSKVNNILKEDLFEGKTTDGKGESLRYDINIGDGTQGTWLVLDTLDELGTLSRPLAGSCLTFLFSSARSNLLRVLHRCSPDTINTTLIPHCLLPDSSFSSPSSLSSPLPSQNGALGSSCRYPEWRIEVSQRAQQSGLGSVSDAMAWVLCGGPPLGPPVPKIGSPELRGKISDLTTEDSSMAHETFSFDVDDGNGDKSDCELEWDSWAEDLMRQALVSSSSDIAVTITEPGSIHPSYPNKRIRPTVSSSTFSSVTLSEHGGRLPSDILPGANMGLLSVDSPALLTAPSVLPFQSTGVTTSTVSAGGIVRARSLIMDGRRGRGVARAMEVLSEDGDDELFSDKPRTGRQRRAREDNSRGTMASSAPAHSSMTVPAPTANTITSTVTVRESVGTPSPPPLQFHSSPGPFYAEGSPRAMASSVSPSPSGLTSASTSTSAGNVSETASVRPGVTTMTTTTTIQLLPRRSSVGGEMLLPEASSPSPSQKRGDRSEKGKGKQPKSPSSRGKVFRPERLVSKLDSALDFVTG